MYYLDITTAETPHTPENDMSTIDIILADNTTRATSIQRIGSTHASHFEITKMWTNACYKTTYMGQEMVEDLAVNFYCSEEGAAMLEQMGQALCSGFEARRTSDGILIPKRFLRILRPDGVNYALPHTRRRSSKL